MNKIISKSSILKMVPFNTEFEKNHFEHQAKSYLPDETIRGLATLCTILLKIQNRLLSEGYSIIKGEVVFPQRVKINEKNTNTT